MYPYIQIVLPSYGVMAFIGFISVLIYLFCNIEKNEIEFTMFLKITGCCVVGGIIGSKVLFAITQLPWLLNHFTIENAIILIPNSGYVYYGGLFGVIGTIYFCTRKDDAKRKKLFNMVAPAIPLFHGFGRIGCFLAGCCYGKHLPQTIMLFGVLEIDRYPVQLIEMLFEFGLFIVLIIILKVNKNVNAIKIYLLVYAVFRFMIEFLRGDIVRGIYFGLSTAQWISLFVIIYYCLKVIRKKNNDGI